MLIQLSNPPLANSYKFLVVWCVYPVKRNPERKLPFKSDEYWPRRYNFGFDEFSRELRQEARYPGRTVVVGKPSRQLKLSLHN